jgi:hypothetical protein
VLRVVTHVVVCEGSTGEPDQSRRECQRQQFVPKGPDALGLGSRLVFPYGLDAEPDPRANQNRNHRNAEHRQTQCEIIA